MSRERLERPWALSGGAAALREQGRRRFENCGCEPRCSNKVNNDDLWQDCFFAVWVFSLWLYQELVESVIGSQGSLRRQGLEIFFRWEEEEAEEEYMSKTQK